MSSHLGSRPVFIGRVDEIAQLRAALDLARTGRGRLVLLSGPPGIGKSRLAAEFVESLAATGIRVLLGRSWEAGGAPPYWPWVQAMRGYLRSADRVVLGTQLAGRVGAMVAMFPELSDVMSLESLQIGDDPEVNRFQLFDAISTFLDEIADSEPLVIVLEDLQAADIPSLLLLEFVVNQIADAALLIVATYRDVELTPEHHLTKTLAELHRSPITVHIALDGLALNEVARFLEAAAGNSAAAGLAAALHRQTSGNPLFLGEAVHLLSGGSFDEVTGALTRVAIPAEVRTVIERRLEVLTPDCKNALEVLSILGNEFEVGVAARLTENEVEALLEVLGEAVSAGLVVDSRGGVGTFGFAHDLVRQTLYAGLSPVVRVRLHRRAASVLEATYGGADDDHLAELALHYFEAATGGDSEKAVEYGRRAGEQAIKRLAYEEAVRLFEMAVQTLDGSEQSDKALLGQMLVALGDAQVQAGDLQAAGKAFRRAAHVAQRIGDARLMGRAAAGYGGRFIWARAGSDTEMVPLLQDALVMLGGEDDTLRVRLLSRLACATRSVGDSDHTAALARQGLELARQLDDPPTLGYALSGLAAAIWWPENSEERVEVGRELIAVGQSAGVIDAVIDGHMTLCAAFAELGDFAAARRELQLLGRAGGYLKLATQRWLEGAMSAVFALSDGAFEEAEPLIEEMLRQHAVTPARDNVSAALFQLFLLRREQGRLHEIVDTVRRASVEFPWYPIHLVALAESLRLVGRVGEARSMLDELADDGFAQVHRDNYWVPSMCLASELIVGLGDVELARSLAEQLTPFARLNAVGFPEGSLGSVARYLGLLAGLVGDHDAAVRWFEDSLAANGRNGARPWVAHTYYDLARVLIERGAPGDDAEAGRRLRSALSICDEIGLTVLHDDVEAALGPHTWPVAQPSPPISALFRREGEYFSISFNGEAFKMRDTKGLRYLGLLLASPATEIHVLDLVAAERGFDPAPRGLITESLDAFTEGVAPVLDRPARAAYERRLAELQDEITEAGSFGDSERLAVARREHEFLVDELASAMGLGGRDRMAASNAERARVNVTRAIRAALAKIRLQGPSLGQHLDSTVRTGAFCSYKPDPLNSFRWSI